MDLQRYDDLPPLPGAKKAGTPAAAPSLPFRIGRGVHEAAHGAVTAAKGITRPFVEPIIEKGPQAAASVADGIKDFGRGITGAAPPVKTAPGQAPARIPAAATGTRQAPGKAQGPGRGTTATTLPLPNIGGGLDVVAPPATSMPGQAPARSAPGAMQFDLSNPFDAMLISQNEPAYREYRASRGVDPKLPVVWNGDAIQGSPQDIRNQGIRDAKALLDHGQQKAIAGGFNNVTLPQTDGLLTGPPLPEAAAKGRVDEFKASLLQRIMEADEADPGLRPEGPAGDGGQGAPAAIPARKARLTALYKELFGSNNSAARTRLLEDAVIGPDGFPTGAKQFYTVDLDSGQALPVALPGAGQGAGKPADYPDAYQGLTPDGKPGWFVKRDGKTYRVSE